MLSGATSFTQQNAVVIISSKVSPISCCRRETLAYPFPQGSAHPFSAKDTLFWRRKTCCSVRREFWYADMVWLAAKHKFSLLVRAVCHLDRFVFCSLNSYAFWHCSAFCVPDRLEPYYQVYCNLRKASWSWVHYLWVCFETGLVNTLLLICYHTYTFKYKAIQYFQKIDLLEF